jgi:hypothetical protein
MKAIPTFWNGRYFRSRLEARWAVFFDELGIAYEYEKEGYDLGSGIKYLPDFWMTDLKFWIEIKPTTSTDEEYEKARRLTASSGLYLYMTTQPIGNIRPWCPAGVNVWEWNYGDGEPKHLAFKGEDGISQVDDGYLWTICPSCGRAGIHFQGRSHRLCRCEAGIGKEGRDESRCEKLLIAYSRALSENFDRPWRTPSKAAKTGTLG